MASNQLKYFDTRAGQTPALDSKATRTRIRDEYRLYLREIEPSHFITFNFGYRIMAIAAQERITRFFNVVERKALGRNWNKKPVNKRLLAVAFPEHLKTNPHWHAIANLSSAAAHTLNIEGRTIWQTFAPRGQLWPEEVKSVEAIIIYSTKKLMVRQSLESVFIYQYALSYCQPLFPELMKFGAYKRKWHLDGKCGLSANKTVI